MTGFFHVPSAFGVLEEKVIPALFKDKSSNDSIRVWVAGCAAGEEAYSVAILLFQYASTLKAPPKIELYATDNDKKSLEIAKKGIYSKTIEAEMSEYCLGKYFVKNASGYAVAPEVKGSILFSSHEVLIDNSFQSFNLITCRHLLGYLDRSSQSQIITFFHHSLKTEGFLFLGDSEFAEGLPGQFESIDSVFKIYRLATTQKEVRDSEPVEESAEIDQAEEIELQFEAETSEEYDDTGFILDYADTEPFIDIGEGDDADSIYTVDKEGQISEDYFEEDEIQQALSAENSLDISEPEYHGYHENGQKQAPFVDSTATDTRVSVNQDTSNWKQSYREELLAQYAPAAVIVNGALDILDHTPSLSHIFKPAKNNLSEDYLSRLPDYDRSRIEEGIRDILAEKDPEETLTIKLTDTGGPKSNQAIDITYYRVRENEEDCVQIVFSTKSEDTDDIAKSGDSVASRPDLFAHGERAGANGRRQEPVKPQSTIEDSYLNVIASSPFPILVHAEGGLIVECSPAWYNMAGVSKAEAPTISEWIKKVRGHRISLKDAELKKAYDKKGVVCISIHTSNRDTKLLAFHSYFLGKDSKGRKLTLTMALDITTYPGNSGIGITPENADYGLAAKKAFLANMSHEIRTPLTSMIGFADYLADNLSGQDVQFAKYISESGNRLLETLNAVMRIASVGEVRHTIKYELLDVTAEVQGVVQLYKPQAEQYDLALKLVVERPAKAILDRAALRRIVANLLGNALKFTLEGSVELTVDASEDTVIVAVQDTGIGITEEFLPFIFDRFSQEAKGQARSNTGCGLGLSIVRELVEVMGGTIHVETAPGKGSKFTIRLPKRYIDTNEDDSSDQTGEGIRKSEPKSQILVVEDNSDTQELLLLILQDKYQVTLTSNAAQTLEIAQKETFDVVLMDLNLGGRRTGFELLRELRKMPRYDSIPVLAVSALPIGVIRKQLIQEGFSGYIAKPFTRARIMDAIGGVLTGSSS